ncbi:hypothetical protein J2T09_000329 [Neorhizobium huautlense]|uniref:Uncharacterized protein n=1 Tax=Neorhizobium huautlense TaxID=67774 RepID=A0ABT9PM98_9HYPH|nr:hypothetical protein [Neorhizobium huautlense]MDP9835588.1 hypothetical protein [Neorhizobium huautlense]
MIKIEILHDGVVIGTSDIEASDPPMGVASGAFTPTEAYKPVDHAFWIDLDCREPGDEIDLAARCAEFGIIRCAGVVIEDASDLGEGRQVTVLGMYHDDYEVAFANDVAFREYYQA